MLKYISDIAVNNPTSLDKAKNIISSMDTIFRSYIESKFLTGSSNCHLPPSVDQTPERKPSANKGKKPCAQKEHQDNITAGVRTFRFRSAPMLYPTLISPDNYVECRKDMRHLAGNMLFFFEDAYDIYTE